MKRSKFFLAATTFILATIAGVGAAKLYHSPMVTVYYKTPTGCVKNLTKRNASIMGTGPICKTLIGASLYTLYTEVCGNRCCNIAKEDRM